MREKREYEPCQMLMDYRFVAAQFQGSTRELRPGEKMALDLFLSDPALFHQLWRELEIETHRTQAAFYQYKAGYYQAKAAHQWAKAAELKAEDDKWGQTERHERLRRNQPLRRLTRRERMRWNRSSGS